MIDHATAPAHDAANVRRDQIIDHAAERERAAWMAAIEAAAVAVEDEAPATQDFNHSQCLPP